MRKFLVIAALLSVSILASAKDTKYETTSAKENRTYVNPENFSHWSLAIGGGANLLIGDFNGNYPTYNSYLARNIDWSVNFQCEYMINPIWGVMLEYMYMAQNKEARNFVAKKKGSYFATDRDLQMHQIDVQMLFNLLNLARRTRTHTNWNFVAGLGVGVLFYELCEDGVYSFKPAPVIPIKLEVQYSPISQLGIFLQGQFNYNFSDYVNGFSGGQVNDMNLYGGIGLRYQIEADKKPHVRLVDMNTYEPLGASHLNVEERERIEEMQNKINFLTEQMNKANNDIARLEQDNKDLMHEADSINASKFNKVNTSVNDLKNQIDSINIEGSDIYINNSNLYQYNSEDNGIYFDYNSAVVKSMYYNDVLKIARRMLNDYKLKIKLIGYCDSRGSIEYNKALAQKRINSIIYILVNRYRIDKERFITDNMGKVEGENEIDEINRRVDVEYYY